MFARAGMAALLALASVGCGSDAEVASGSTRAPKVLVIGVDGARPDTLVAADTPNFDSIAAREG
ncbi:MAG: hypothetical protein R3B07_27785 [Polyangiaceae bacterium]